MLVGSPVTIHPTPAPADGNQVIEVAVTVTPPPGLQFVMLAVPIGDAMARLENPSKATPAKR
jgi:hypothetical protein